MNKKPSLDSLLHYGVKRKSGRYPWGSGEDPRQSESSYGFMAKVDELRSKGLNDTQIAPKLGMNTTQLRNAITYAKKERNEFIRKSVSELEKTGISNTAMAKELGVSEATIRNYRNKGNAAEKQQKMQLNEVEDAIKSGMSKTGYLDVGVGVERQLGISRTKFNAVVNKLAKEDGYHIHEVYVERINGPQGVGKKYTTVKVLTKDPDKSNTNKNSHKIATLQTQIDLDSGKISNIGPPKHINLDRVKVRYLEEGGGDKDGLIELRPGVDDLDLGKKRYAQVRIAAGEDLYLKGMAAYSNKKDFPDGIDIIFNTNKELGTPKEKVLKKMKDDMDNPFGANIVRQKGALNIVNEEGDWATWSSKMSSQFLSKQPVSLIKDRLDDTYSSLRKEFDEINSMTNPIVKKHLMDKYIEGLDSKAKHLKAKGLPNTRSHVILPFPDMNPGEVYAPLYKNGERVVLVRHPHGGKFEIPDLVVNNKNVKARSMLGTDSPDAIGIHPSVAQKLSGADFDGDTVLVIPNTSGKIKSSRALQELKNFEPKQYAVDYDTISPKMKQTQMGIVSNLITDMTIKGASDSELARAVKHSMVVIDSEKHRLDYKQSARDNQIASLIKTYQSHVNPETGRPSKGASTLISRSKQKIDISQPDTVRNLHKDKVDSRTGKVLKKGLTTSEIADKLSISEKTVKEYINNPKAKFDPDKYSSRTAQEDLYSGYVKGIIATKNEALKVSKSIPTPAKSKEAAKIYADEIKSLDEKLNVALLNAPRERQAQILNNKLFYSNLKPGMDKDDIKKLKKRSLARARDTVGAKKSSIGSKNLPLTEQEWEAIQARAVSPTKLKQILDNADMDVIRKYASPREVKLSSSKVSRAKMLLDKGYTLSEVSQVMGVSPTTLREEIAK